MFHKTTNRLGSYLNRLCLKPEEQDIEGRLKGLVSFASQVKAFAVSRSSNDQDSSKNLAQDIVATDAPSEVLIPDDGLKRVAIHLENSDIVVLRSKGDDGKTTSVLAFQANIDNKCVHSIKLMTCNAMVSDILKSVCGPEDVKIMNCQLPDTVHLNSFSQIALDATKDSQSTSNLEGSKTTNSLTEEASGSLTDGSKISEDPNFNNNSHITLTHNISEAISSLSIDQNTGFLLKNLGEQERQNLSSITSNGHQNDIDCIQSKNVFNQVLEDMNLLAAEVLQDETPPSPLPPKMTLDEDHIKLLPQLNNINQFKDESMARDLEKVPSKLNDERNNVVAESRTTKNPEVIPEITHDLKTVFKSEDKSQEPLVLVKGEGGPVTDMSNTKQIKVVEDFKPEVIQKTLAEISENILNKNDMISVPLLEHQPSGTLNAQKKRERFEKKLSKLRDLVNQLTYQVDYSLNQTLPKEELTIDFVRYESQQSDEDNIDLIDMKSDELTIKFVEADEDQAYTSSEIYVESNLNKTRMPPKYKTDSDMQLRNRTMYSHRSHEDVGVKKGRNNNSTRNQDVVNYTTDMTMISRTKKSVGGDDDDDEGESNPARTKAPMIQEGEALTTFPNTLENKPLPEFKLEALPSTHSEIEKTIPAPLTCSDTVTPGRQKMYKSKEDLFPPTGQVEINIPQQKTTPSENEGENENLRKHSKLHLEPDEPEVIFKRFTNLRREDSNTGRNRIDNENVETHSHQLTTLNSTPPLATSVLSHPEITHTFKRITTFSSEPTMPRNKSIGNPVKEKEIIKLQATPTAKHNKISLGESKGKGDSEKESGSAKVRHILGISHQITHNKSNMYANDERANESWPLRDEQTKSSQKPSSQHQKTSIEQFYKPVSFSAVNSIRSAQKKAVNDLVGRGEDIRALLRQRSVENLTFKSYQEKKPNDQTPASEKTPAKEKWVKMSKSLLASAPSKTDAIDYQNEKSSHDVRVTRMSVRNPSVSTRPSLVQGNRSFRSVLTSEAPAKTVTKPDDSKKRNV